MNSLDQVLREHRLICNILESFRTDLIRHEERTRQMERELRFLIKRMERIERDLKLLFKYKGTLE